MVSRFIQAGSDARFTIYHAELRPWLWALTLTENCRIFQHLSVADIIKKIFNELGFSDYRFKLMYPHEPREYCVQYQETAFNFISRLMEDEGMFYFFEHQANQHTLIIADDLCVHPACPGIDTARFCHSPNNTTPEDVITQCQFGQQMVSGQYAVDDFNFEIPTVRLRTQVGGPCGDYRIYEYAAGYGKRDQGDTKVRRRIEAHELEHQLLEGQSHCFSFTAGHQFKLTEHIRAEFNRSYVLRWVAHTLSLTHYSNAFKAFPVELPFRPPLTTPKPKIVSTQTAMVAGPNGEEIYTDQYGRIKVQFHWDQEGQYDENSSCWIRVNQGLAGKTWGNLFIPRIGQEVIISFLNGNPDTPIVTGAVYNGRQPVPYPLPAEQTKSTLKTNSSKGGAPFANYNELRFEDKMGQEEIYLQGEKDWNILIKNDKSQIIGHDETLSVANNRRKTVGVNQSETIGANKSIQVGANHDETIGSNMSLTVNNNKTETVAMASAETIGAGKALTIGGGYQVSVGAGMNTTVGLGQFEEIGLVKHVIVGNKIVFECGLTPISLS